MYCRVVWLKKLCCIFIRINCATLKGIVSRDFGGLQMILIDRLCVPDVPLNVYSFLKLHLNIVFFNF